MILNLDNYTPNYKTCPAPSHGPRPDLNQLIDIPFYNFRQDFSICDCWGITRLFYALYGVQFNIDDYYYIDEKEHLRRDWTKCFQYLKENFDEQPPSETYQELLKSLHYGDAICWQRHIGVYIGMYRGKPSLICQPFGSTLLETQSRIIPLDKEYFHFEASNIHVYRPARFCEPYSLTCIDKSIIDRNHKLSCPSLPPFDWITDDIDLRTDTYTRFLTSMGYNKQAKKLSVDAVTLTMHIESIKKRLINDAMSYLIENKSHKGHPSLSQVPPLLLTPISPVFTMNNGYPLTKRTTNK